MATLVTVKSPTYLDQCRWPWVPLREGWTFAFTPVLFVLKGGKEREALLKALDQHNLNSTDLYKRIQILLVLFLSAQINTKAGSYRPLLQKIYKWTHQVNSNENHHAPTRKVKKETHKVCVRIQSNWNYNT